MNNVIFNNAIKWWTAKGIIMLVIYFWLIYPNLSTDTAFKNLINIAYGIITIFVIFGMNKLDITGLISLGKK